MSCLLAMALSLLTACTSASPSGPGTTASANPVRASPPARPGPSNRFAIHTLRIASVVVAPGPIYYSEPPPLSFSISTDTPPYDGAGLRRALEESGLDLGEIVREQLAQSLVATGAFELTGLEEADGRLEVELSLLTFGPTNGLYYNRRRPSFSLHARLVRQADGVTLWKGSRLITSMNPRVPAYTTKELIQNPSLPRESLTVAARIVSDKVVRDLTTP